MHRIPEITNIDNPYKDAYDHNYVREKSAKLLEFDL